MTADNSRRAALVALMGATGEGKSTAVRLALAELRPSRLLVWDFKREYSALGASFEDRKKFYDRLMAARSGDFRLVWRPSFDLKEGREQFDWFCQLAYHVGDVQVVADELHTVMLSNWAPKGWRTLISAGRDRGCKVIAASQRPADIEKGLWDQATMIRSCRLNGEASARCMSGVLMVPWSEIVTLPELHFVQRSMRGGVIQWGRIEWTRAKPREVILREENIFSRHAPA